MSKDNVSGLDRQIHEELSGFSEIEKLKTLLMLQEGSLSRWAVRNGHLPEELFMTLSGKRPYPELREKLARAAGVSLERIGEIIEANRAPEEAVA